MEYYYSDKANNELEVGIDEAGRGCLAGPVVAACVVLPDSFPDDMYLQIKDSKKLSEKKRLVLFDYIKKYAKDYAVSFVSNYDIDKINILQASFKAMHKCLHNLALDPTFILVDGHMFKPFNSKKSNDYIDYVCIKGGDNKYLAIAAASILAKVSRDEYMKRLCLKYPELEEKYGWYKNKAYGTKQHMEGIKKHGITNIHRKSFGICKNKDISLSINA